MEKQGGIYARYSPGRDRDQTSTIEAQVAMCREKAGRDGVAIDDAHIYVDRGISGASVARAGFQAMLAAIEAGNFPEILYAKDDKRLCSETSARQAGSSNGSGSRISRFATALWTLAIRERTMSSGSCSASSILSLN